MVGNVRLVGGVLTRGSMEGYTENYHFQVQGNPSYSGAITVVATKQIGVQGLFWGSAIPLSFEGYSFMNLCWALAKHGAIQVSDGFGA